MFCGSSIRSFKRKEAICPASSSAVWHPESVGSGSIRLLEFGARKTYFSLSFSCDHDFWQVSVGKVDAWMDAKGEKEAEDERVKASPFRMSRMTM